MAFKPCHTFAVLKPIKSFINMKKVKVILTFLLLFQFCFNFAQTKPSTAPKIKVTGTIVEKNSKQPLEYATITFINTANPKAISGGITNAKGEFDIDLNPGTYDIKIEFISFKTNEIKQKNIPVSTNLGQLTLEEDAAQLNEVVVIKDKSAVEIKLDKKVYTIGKDFMVRGGTISDVLDNIPSVTVDQDGAVSLRGNPDVRIFIDGKPSNAVNIAEVLRTLSAESIEKVEVITNPSSRYESEGSAGILNIILKKGKNQGLNGTVTGTVGSPKNYGISANVNYKTENANFYTVLGSINRNNPGNSITNTEYLNPDGTPQQYIYETTVRERNRSGYNSIFGIDWDVNESLNWTNTLSYRKTNGNSPENTIYDNYDQNFQYTSTNYRSSNVTSENQNAEFTTNLIKKFKKEGHKLTLLASASNDIDDENSTITSSTLEATSNDQQQNNNLIQLDYVLPLSEGSQVEAGYRGNFNKLQSNNTIDSLDINGNNLPVNSISNFYEYKESINAFYAQYGKKIDRFSTLFGMRWEASNININELITNDYNKKTYNDFFPSVIVNYQISEESNAGISYTRRVNRPRGRLINPFTNYTSNINIFRGNPNLDPSFTDALNFQYYKKWNKLTFDTSLYLNLTTDGFQFVRLETGRYVYLTPGDPSTKTPVILTTPINLAKEQRFGYEFTINYTPFKWWRLNGNFNIYAAKTQGDFSYTNLEGEEINENFDTNIYGWFTRLTSRFTLPYKIDFVTNTSYNAPQKTVQGTSVGVFSANLSLTKDVMKDKGTIAFNIQDVFNSRKRITETYIPGVLNSYSEMQWQTRQFNLSFTYRFNKKKGEKEKLPKGNSDDGGGEFQG